jgi:voltage-gated potassium channel
VAEAMDDRSKVNTFFDAIYWSVITIATVGYGDIVPVTFEGKAVALLLVVSSLGIIAFSTSIFTTSFTQKMFELKKNRDLGKIKNLKNYCVICGYGKIGQIVAQRLIENGDNVVVVDNDHTKVELARLKNIIALNLDATKSETLVSIGVGGNNISSILCLTDSEAVNLYISLGVRYLNKDVMVVASIDNKSTYKKFLLAGVNHIIYPYEAMAKMGIEYMNHPIAYEALYTTLFGKEDAFLEEVYVKKGTFLDGKNISNINFKSYKLIVFGVLRNKDFTFNPSKNFVLAHGDKLMLIGYKESIEYFNTLVRR